jgi:flagellar biogenesis protein FliO
LAQVSDTESRPLAPTPPQNPALPQNPQAPGTTTTAKSSAQTDPLKELARRLSADAAQEENRLATERRAAAGNTESKPLPTYQPPEDKPTENEIRSKQLLLSHPSESKPLGTSGQGLVPDNADPKNEEAPLGSYSNTGSWVLNTVTALGVVIGLILIMRMVMNKLTGRSVIGGRSGIVEVLSRTSISPRNQVMLLRLGQRIIVVSEGPTGMRTLANVDDPDEVANLLSTVSSTRPGSITQNFNQLLNRAGTEMDDPAAYVQEHGGDDDEHMVDRARNELSSLLSKVKSMSKGGRDV